MLFYVMLCYVMLCSPPLVSAQGHVGNHHVCEVGAMVAEVEQHDV